MRGREFIKRTILSIAILCCISLLAGCNRNPDETFSIHSGNESAKLNLYYPSHEAQIPPDEYVLNWENYIMDKYNVGISLTYMPFYIPEEKNPFQKPDISNQKVGINMDELVELSDTNGLIILYQYEDLMELIGQDLLMPVNEFLNNSEVLRNLSVKNIDVLTDINGIIWALPMRGSDAISYNKRTYNKDWLKKADMEVPETIEEFIEFAEYVAHEDPDNNGKDDTYIMDYSDQALVRYFEDVFKAFGCYSDGLSPVGYNPHEMAFENMVFDENFVDAMAFIKFLKDAELIINKDYAQQNYKVASSFTHDMDLDYVKDKAYGYFLKGLNDTLLIEENYYENCLAVLKYTDNAERAIELFYNIIYSNDNSFMDFAYGIEGEDYFDEGDYYRASYTPLTSRSVNSIGIYATLNRPELAEKPIIFNDDKVSRKSLQLLKKFYREQQEAKEGAENFLDTNLLYRINFDAYSYKSKMLSDNSNFPALTTLFSDVLNYGVNIEDAIAEYSRSIN